MKSISPFAANLKSISLSRQKVKPISLLLLAALAPACSSAPMGPGGNPPSVSFNMKVTVPAGGELHDCQFVKMPAGEQYVIAAEHKYTPGSHHLLLFRTDLAAIPAGGDQIQDCYEGAGGTIMSHVRGVVYGSQVPQGSQTLPAGVGFKMKSEEVLLLQVHYLNASPKPADASVTVGLTTTTEAAKIHDLAGVLFYYDPFIDVPAQSMAMAGARCTLPKDITLQTIFPHYHSRGYGYRAFLDLPSQPPSTAPFYTSTDWEHPAAWKDGPLLLKAGTKIRFYCDYNNSGGSAEYFQGPSAATNEMCMFTGMYYPAMDQASEYCLSDMDQFGTGAAACAATSSCVQSCPPGSAPTGLGSANAGAANVDPCWQKCFVASCPTATTPLFAQFKCIGARCATQCGAGGSGCTACAIQNCPNEVSACQQHACN